MLSFSPICSVTRHTVYWRKDLWLGRLQGAGRDPAGHAAPSHWCPRVDVPPCPEVSVCVLGSTHMDVCASFNAFQVYIFMEMNDLRMRGELC